MQHCPARLARGCQRARLHLDRCDAGMGMGAGARRWNWLVTHNRAAFSTCAAGCGAPTENCWRCRPHSRDALRHTRPMEASLRPRGQSGERSAAACGSPSKSRRSRPCGHGKLGLQHAVAAPATEPPAATSNHGPRQPPSRTQPQRAWGRARSGTGTGIRPGGRSIHLLVPVYVRFKVYYWGIRFPLRPSLAFTRKRPFPSQTRRFAACHASPPAHS